MDGTLENEREQKNGQEEIDQAGGQEKEEQPKGFAARTNRDANR